MAIDGDSDRIQELWDANTIFIRPTANHVHDTLVPGDPDYGFGMFRIYQTQNGVTLPLTSAGTVF